MMKRASKLPRMTGVEIAKLDLRDGDTLVVKPDRVITGEQARTLGKQVEDALGSSLKDISVMVLAGGVSLAVLRKGEPQE